MKTLFSSLVFGLLLTGSAYATNVHLLNGSPQEGEMRVEYQILYQTHATEKVMTTTLPKTITLPDNAKGIRVISLTNNALPTAGHRFVFPKPSCEWNTSLGTPAEITFSASHHQVSCH